LHLIDLVLANSYLVLLFLTVISLVLVVLLLAFLRDDLLELLFSLLLFLKVILLGSCFHRDTRVDLGEEQAEDTLSIFPIEIVEVDLIGQWHVG